MKSTTVKCIASAVILFVLLLCVFEIAKANEPVDPGEPTPTVRAIKLHNNTDLEDDLDDGDGKNHFYIENKAGSKQTMTVHYTANGQAKTKEVKAGDEPVGIFPDSGTDVSVTIPENTARTCGYTKGSWWKESVQP